MFKTDDNLSHNKTLPVLVLQLQLNAAATVSGATAYFYY